jgi:uncharacterized protein (TIGR02996 family)
MPQSIEVVPDPLEDAFLQQIRAEPENTLHPLVYADWLEEQGDPKAAQIRAWHTLRMDPYPWQQTDAKLKTLWALTDDFWTMLRRMLTCEQTLLGCEFIQQVLPDIRTAARSTAPECEPYLAQVQHLQQEIRRYLTSEDDNDCTLPYLATQEHNARLATHDYHSKHRTIPYDPQRRTAAIDAVFTITERLLELSVGLVAVLTRYYAADRVADQLADAARQPGTVLLQQPEYKHVWVTQNLIVASYQLFNGNALPRRAPLSS